MKLSKIFLFSLVYIFTISCKNNHSESPVESSMEENPIVIPKGDVKTEVQSVNSNGVSFEWLTFNDIHQGKPTDQKKYLVDVYTDWCGWCKVMDKKTFSEPEVINYVKSHFHMIKFNAEQTDPVFFKGKEYQWVAGGRKGVNELATELLDGRMGYPTLVYLDENLEKIKVSPGFKNAEQLILELKSLDN